MAIAHGQKPVKAGAPGKASGEMRKQKADPMSLRMDADTRELIDRAAKSLGQTRTNFMLDSARERATEVLLNQTFVILTNKEWQTFNAALNSAPPPNAKLKALLMRKPPWENGS